VRVGVIGTGFGERVVAPTFAATPGCAVVDVVSARDEAGIDALCRRSDVDLVSVHSPPFLHAPHVRAALAQGVNVLCDKPFAMDASEAVALCTEAERAEIVHLVNFEFRQSPGRRRLKEMVDDGAVGTVEHLQWTQFSAGSRVPLRPYGWLFDRSLGGGWVGAWGSHAVDTIRWMLGDIESARADLRTTITERPDASGTLHTCDADDGFTASMTLASGATVAIDTTFVAAADVAGRIVITGSEGVVESVGDARITLRRDGGKEQIDIPQPEGDRHAGPMATWAAIVRDAVMEGEQITPSFADGAACDRVLDQLRGRYFPASSRNRL
jgi:predicted dehydrogenase